MENPTEGQFLSNSLLNYRNTTIPSLNVTSTPVVCKDGTTKNQINDPNARVLDACRDNGGRAENPTDVNAPSKEVLSQDKEDNFYRSLGFTTSGMIKPKVKGRLLVAVVLVAGYFAFKKFNK
jgi:hypothetical protein